MYILHYIYIFFTKRLMYLLARMYDRTIKYNDNNNIIRLSSFRRSPLVVLLSCRSHHRRRRRCGRNNTVLLPPVSLCAGGRPSSDRFVISNNIMSSSTSVLQIGRHLARTHSWIRFVGRYCSKSHIASRTRFVGACSPMITATYCTWPWHWNSQKHLFTGHFSKIKVICSHRTHTFLIIFIMPFRGGGPCSYRLRAHI